MTECSPNIFEQMSMLYENFCLGNPWFTNNTPISRGSQISHPFQERPIKATLRQYGKTLFLDLHLLRQFEMNSKELVYLAKGAAIVE